MRKILWTAGLGAALSFGACGEQGSDVDPLDFGYEGTGIGITIAPLDLPGVTDACYSFDIRNGATPSERVVARGSAQDTAGDGIAGQGGDGGPENTGDPLSGTIANPLCGSQFGFRGEISYVAPCDASLGNETHTVTLWVNAVCQSGLGIDNCVPLEGFVNPCGPTGCTVTTTCVENADVPVEFNFTVMASAQQGFFDIAVNFDNVFCSAKLDTCYEDDSLINLLHGATGREHTAVAAVACTAGTGAADTDGDGNPIPNTYLHFTTFSVTCGADTYNLILAGVAQEGNLDGTPGSPFITAGENNNLTAAIYYGTEDLQSGGENANKVYTNIAFLLPQDEDCVVNWTVVPSTTEDGPQPDDGSGGTFTQVAGVDFQDVAVSRGVCVRNQLNSMPDEDAQTNPLISQVVTDYFTRVVPYSAKLAQGAEVFADP